MRQFGHAPSEYTASLLPLPSRAWGTRRAGRIPQAGAPIPRYSPSQTVSPGTSVKSTEPGRALPSSPTA